MKKYLFALLAIPLAALSAQAQCHSKYPDVDVSNLLIPFWDDILAVNRNFATNGNRKLEPGKYQWYVDGKISPGDTLSYLYDLKKMSTYQLRFLQWVKDTLRITDRPDTIFVTEKQDTMCTTPIDWTKDFYDPPTAFSVYPNPATGPEITVRCIRDASEPPVREVGIYTASGTLMCRQTLSEGDATTVDISQLQQGIYLVRVGRKTATVIVENGKR